MSKIFSVSDKLTVSTAWLYAIGKFNDEKSALLVNPYYKPKDKRGSIFL